MQDRGAREPHESEHLSVDPLQRLSIPPGSDRLGQRKVNCLLDVKPDLIVTANAGCSLQLQAQLKKSGSSVPVVHPMELLDLSYRGKTVKELA